MLHEISPLHFDNAYYPYQAQQGDVVLCYKGDALLLQHGEECIAYPVFDESSMDATHCIYLFSINHKKFFVSLKEITPDGFEFAPVQSLRGAEPQQLSFAGTVGRHLFAWYQARRFCGACGQRMAHDHKERMLHCAACDNKEYPQIMPAVIVGVVDDDRLLLTRYAPRGTRHQNARLALVAGYTEIGETLEETVRREVREETGLEVSDITYYKSQPWGFTGSLLAGFYARVSGSNRVTLNEEELSEAIFVSRNDIDLPYANVSLTNEMICRFRDIGPEQLVCHDPLRCMPYSPIPGGVQ